jgi:hypothetical protein
MRGAIKTLIEGDATLSGLLTGGVFAGREISRNDTPGAFDANGEIQPCALVKLSTESAFGPRAIGGNQVIDIYLYERDGTTTIDQAIDAMRDLLHNTKISSGAAWWCEWSNDIRDTYDDALRCDMAVSSYTVARFRG